MQQTLIFIAGILGLSLILSVSIHVFGRLRIEQQRSLQKLVDQGVAGDALLRAIGWSSRGDRDRRRGVLLIAIGLAWTGITFFIGGSAWILGFAPISLGLACLVLWKLDG